MLTDFALALYNWRMNNRLTQPEAAEKLNVSLSSICNWEKGRVQPRMHVVDRIAPLIGYDQDDEVEVGIPRYKPFTERMAESRGESFDHYLARTREMVAEREETSAPRKNHRDALLRLAGFLEGLRIFVGIESPSYQMHLDKLEELIKEETDEREDY